MIMLILRVLVFSLFLFAGYFMGQTYHAIPEGIGMGLLSGSIALLVEKLFRTVRVGKIIGGIVGLAVGLIFANLILFPLRMIVSDLSMASFLLTALFGYGGLLIGLKRGETLTIPGLFRIMRGQGADDHVKILDTSVIIDGRVADVCETGFIDGLMIIPQFVLRELQLVADSSDPLKRNRGRRGLDILQRMQKMGTIQIQIVEEDFPHMHEVDLKLIELAKQLEGKIVTNDFNLNKMAQLQGVAVLNVNELANALKPVVLPGEIMHVFILKEGKEYNQGVAYLDDGTMVVVDNAKKMISKTIDIAVTSVLQTTAGKMIFGKFEERKAVVEPVHQ